MHPTRALVTWLPVALIAAVLAAPGVSRSQSPQPEAAKPRSPVVVELRRDGFHWGDAGVGAAATLAVVAMAAGVALLLRDRRDRAPTRDTR